MTTYKIAVQKNLQLENAERTVATQKTLLQAALSTTEEQETALARLRGA